MAQVLREGCTYSLITEEKSDDKRKVYFVKLTDSCLKAIEEYTDEFKRSGNKTKSVIRFDAQGGAIILPGASTTKGSKKTFLFQISNVLTSDTNPLQECMKCNRNSEQLLSYGPLVQKISIAATDDCYENTRNRMAQVDQERKDIRTKEIKLGSMKRGKKSHSKMLVSDTPRMSPVKNVRKYNAHLMSSPKPTTSSTTATSKPNLLTSTTHSSIMLKKTSSSNISSPGKDKGKEFTCRDRVVHILSLRPHKKSDLILRLQREGMNQQQDKGNLPTILQQVATYTDNQYLLLPNLYIELQVDSWPFFSENERRIARKNIASNKKSNVTSYQDVSSTSKSPEDKSPLKRSLLVPGSESKNTNKKTKIISNNEPPLASVSISPKPPENENTNTSCVPNKNITTPHTSCPPNEIESQGVESPPIVASTSNSPEYLSVYKPITSKEQRFQYKRDFQLEYDEYLKLKKYLDEVHGKFIKLENSLKKTEEGSVEYIRIQNEILCTYNKQQQDEKYYKTKCRHDKLQQKLSHIKRLVMEYDNHMENT